MRVAIAICTWNRSALLDQTLAQLRRLRVPERLEWEVVVVNNNCTDDTDAVLARHAGALPLRRLFEPKPGHSNARNCALANTTADWVLWTDDDALVEEGWLAALVEAARRHPDAGAVGGPIEAWFPVAPDPELLEAFPVLRFGFCGIENGPGERALNADEWVFGANMAFQTRWAEGLRFEPSLGRVGTSLVSGDDTDFQARVRARGAAILWAPAMRVKHYVEPARMTLSYLCEFYEALGRTTVRSVGVPEGPRLFGYPRWVLRRYVESYCLAFLCRLAGRRVERYARLREFHRSRGMLRACREKVGQAFQPA
jgi:glycosyltransferase involved in cell wall biosynthesis